MILLLHVDVCRWPMLLLLFCSFSRLSAMCLVRFSWCLVLHRCIVARASLSVRALCWKSLVSWFEEAHSSFESRSNFCCTWLAAAMYSENSYNFYRKQKFCSVFSTFFLCFDGNKKCDEQQEKLKKNEILRHLAAFCWEKLRLFSYSFSFWFKSWLFLLTHSITSDAFALLTHFIHKQKQSLFVHSHSSTLLRRCRVKLWKL